MIWPFGGSAKRPPRIGAAPIFISVVDTYPNLDLNRGSCNDTAGRTVVPAADVMRGRIAVMLIFGQSNGANSGQGPYTPKRRVFNFNVFDGLCYVARDPLLGATESGGNFTSRMADLLIERGVFDTVVLAPIGVGGSRVEEWTTGGSRHRRLQIAIKRAADAGLTFTHLLWHQGESNANHGPDRQLYAECLMNIHAAVRSYGVNAPLFVAQASVCRCPPNEAIRSAQRAVVDPARGIFAGPDSDTIGLDHRYDACHMKESGLILHAELWAQVLAKAAAVP